MASINRFLTPANHRKTESYLANFVPYDLSTGAPQNNNLVDFGQIPMFRNPFGYYQANEVQKFGKILLG